LLPDEVEALAAVAFHNERVRARRLAASAGLSQAQALHAILVEAAGAAGLDQLIAARHAEKNAEVVRRAHKLAARAAAQAIKKAGPVHAPGTWLGWFDGSAQPNPGRIGIGARLQGPEGAVLEISRHAGHGNSGEAEYLALIALLEAALPQRPPALVIHGDSRVVIDDMLTRGDKGAAGLEDYRQRARELMAQLPGVTLCWVPRHRNGHADRLSQQARAVPEAAAEETADEADFASPMPPGQATSA
jgi:ribonuclease HI